MKRNTFFKSFTLIILACAYAFCQTTISPYLYRSTVKYPFDYDTRTDSLLPPGTKYVPAGIDNRDSVYWGWQCVVTGGPSLAFGGNRGLSADGRLHTNTLKDGKWTRIDSLLRATNPLQSHCDSIFATALRLDRILAKARYIFFEGKIETEESKFLADSVNNSLAAISAEITSKSSALNELSSLSTYHSGQRTKAVEKLSRAQTLCVSLGTSADASKLTNLRQAVIALEQAAEHIDAEPSERVLSMIAYDSASSLFVIFGGDHLDYLLNDLWVFNPAIPRWEQRHPYKNPQHRADHRLLSIGNGRFSMKGGFIYGAGGLGYKHIGPSEWFFDLSTNNWETVTGGSGLTHSDTRGYRIVPNTPEFFMGGDKPSAVNTKSFLDTISKNVWVEMNPPFRSASNRDWGTVAYDAERDMVYIYCGGHSAYGGTDVLHYHMSTNRYEQPVAADLPLGMQGASGTAPTGWSFNKQPWMSNHTWNSYEYHPKLKQMVLAGRQQPCCGAITDDWIYFYNPTTTEWTRKYHGLPFSVQGPNVCNMKNTMINWSGRELWELNDSTLNWTKWTINGTVPTTSVDFCGIIYDSLRDRILMFSCEGYNLPFNGAVHSLDLKTKTVTKLIPSNAAAMSNTDYLREIVYLPELDKFLFVDDLTTGAGKYLLYDPNANLWMSASIPGKLDKGVNSGLIYDKKRKLVWHFNNGYSTGDYRAGNVRVLKIDSASLQVSPVANTVAEKTGLNGALSMTLFNSLTSNIRICVGGVSDNGNIDLEVYSSDGVKVATLYNGQTNLKSSLNINWNTSKVASGVYFVNLKHQGRTLTSRIPVIQ
ncbi:MAG: T9SS type A sorting domain-containing protein [Fibrobacteres bacterium]|nr:T9SS type A sorting domain-containing protein [Fibrobacterota bacterium]